MISFVNDYSQNACPEILEELKRTNLEGNLAYSSDEHNESIKKTVRRDCQ